MLTEERKAEILQALYQAASDPRQHENFVDEFADVLAGSEQGENQSWLEPHIETAIGIFEKLNFSGLLDPSSLSFVETYSGPAMVVNSSAEILASNAAWIENCGGENFFEMIPYVQDQVLVRNALRSLNTILEDRTEIIRLSGMSTTFPVLSFRRIPSSGNSNTNSDRILVRTLGLAWPSELIEFLKLNFELSSKEIQTLRLIASGLTLSEVAEKIQRSREAVKSHTKSIYAKLEISGREDLVRLVVQLQSLFEPTLRESPPASRSRKHQFVQLSDGRRIFWTEKGARAGRRLLFLHGLSLGHEFADRFETLLHEHNLKLLCIDRPGYGRSDPPKNWKNGLEEWIDLYPELARQLDIEGTPLVAHTGGILFATAVAAHHPQLVTGICALACGVPIRERKKLSEYPAQARMTAMAARLSPSLLRFLIMNAAHYFRTPEGRDRMIKRAYANASIDREALSDSTTFRKLGTALEMIADGGFDGYVSDNLHIFGDWSRYPNRAKCEIAYLNGSEDEVCPIDWAREFAGTCSNLTVDEAVGAGYLMLHTHPERCIEHLLTCLNRF